MFRIDVVNVVWSVGFKAKYCYASLIAYSFSSSVNILCLLVQDYPPDFFDKVSKNDQCNSSPVSQSNSCP